MKTKHFLIALLLGIFWSSSVAFAYVMGGTNLGYSGYPEFRGYLSSYNTSRYDIERYLDEVKEYVKNGDNDKQRITEAQNNAIREANEEVARYNRGSRY